MMTGNKYIFAALAAAAMLASCGKKPSVDPSEEPQPYTITLHAGFEALSKAGADTDTGEMTWTIGDRIAVGLDDGSFIAFDLVSGAGTSSAEFSGFVPAGRTVSGTALYPYEFWSTDGSSVSIPTEVEYVSDAYTPAVMVATIDGDSMNFTHKGGIIRFTIKGIPASATKFMFTCEGGVYGNDSYSVTFPAGVSSRVFSVPVQEGTIEPYTVSLLRDDGDVMVSQSKKSSTQVARRDLRVLTPLEVVSSGNFRILEYNIYNGMAGDADNNYDNFVEWMQEMAPDVVVLCESWNSNDAAQSTSKKYSQAMVKLAARYGHDNVQYVRVVEGKNGDDFPVAITSSHPITLVQRFDDRNYTKHGAMHLQVAGYDIVALHLLPTLDYGFDAEVTNKFEYYGGLRLSELQYILDNTLLSDKYADREDWLFIGDFNMYSSLEYSARSPLGGTEAINYGKNAPTAYKVYDKMIDSGLTDVLYKWGSEVFQPTMYHGRSRIDYVFASPSVYSTVSDASVVLGGFPGNYCNDKSQNPSDHFPIMVDLTSYSFKVLDGVTRIDDMDEETIVNEL